MAKRRILCVCRTDTCVGPMFAAILQATLRSLGKTEFSVESAGILETPTDVPVTREVLTCMRRRCIDLSSHRSRFIGQVPNLQDIYLIVCMDPGILEQVSEMLSRSVPNATEMRIQLPNPPHGIFNPWHRGQEAHIACDREIMAWVDRLIPTLG